MRYRFQDCEYLPVDRELRRKGVKVELPDTVLAMLAHLIDHRHRVVTREELAKAAWPDRFVADHTLTARLSDLRRALTTRKRSHPLRTVYGKGVRFVAEVSIESPRSSLVDRANEAAHAKQQEKGRPSIAVLPFKRGKLQPSGVDISSALPDDIISELTNLRWLFVIARGSTFQFPSYADRLSEIGRQLQARYCLSGEVQDDEPGKVRVTVELAETLGETILWREGFAIPIAGAHELRQEIVKRIAGELDQRITSHEIARARLKAPSNLDSWGWYHSGMAKVQGHNLSQLDGALDDFSRSVEIDPRFARGFTGLVHTRWLRFLNRELDKRTSELMGLIEAAKRAEEIDPNDSLVLVSMGRASWFTGKLDSAKDQFRQAIKMSPSSTPALTNLAGLQMMLGEAEAAFETNSEAIALSPLDPNIHTWLATQVGALSQLNRHEEAVEHADRAIASPHAIMPTYAMALLAYYQAGRLERGQEVARRLKRMRPNISAEEVGRKLPMLQRFKEAFGEAFSEFGLGR